MKIYPTGGQGEIDGRLARGRPQVTFLTPLKDLPRFVAAIRPFLGELSVARFRVDQVVFDPTTLGQILQGEEISQCTFTGDTIETVGADEALHILELALSDWIDFLLCPEPDTLLIYADHDEFITFCPRNVERLDSLTRALTEAGFEKVKFTRTVHVDGYTGE